ASFEAEGEPGRTVRARGSGDQWPSLSRIVARPHWRLMALPSGGRVRPAHRPPESRAGQGGVPPPPCAGCRRVVRDLDAGGSRDRPEPDLLVAARADQPIGAARELLRPPDGREDPLALQEEVEVVPRPRVVRRVRGPGEAIAQIYDPVLLRDVGGVRAVHLDPAGFPQAVLPQPLVELLGDHRPAVGGDLVPRLLVSLLVVGPGPL